MSGFMSFRSPVCEREKRKKGRERKKGKKGARVCGDICVRDICTTKITGMFGFMSFRSPVCERERERKEKRAREKGGKKGARVKKGRQLCGF